MLKNSRLNLIRTRWKTNASFTLMLLTLAVFAACSGSASNGNPPPGAAPAGGVSDTGTTSPQTQGTASTRKPPTSAPPPTTSGGAATATFDENGQLIPPAPKAKPLTMNSPAYSVQAFMWYRPETAERDLNMIQAMGFGWVKQEFAWRDIEGAKKGAFDWSRADAVIYAANAKRIDILARLDNAPDWAAPGCFNPAKSTMGPPKKTQDWLDFLTAFATRYKQRVRAYEIWNEPNLAREWCNAAPNPAAYAQFLKASYAAVKAVDPNAMIISAGLTPTTCCPDGGQALPDATFFKRMYDAMGGKSTGYFDVLGVHAAGYKAEPEADPAVVAKDPVLTNHDASSTELKRIYCFRHVEDIHQIMVDHGEGNKQIAILEFGWTSDATNPAYSWFRVDENAKADRIVRAYQYAKAHWAPWIGVMSLIYMANPDWSNTDEKYWWAITNPDGTPRPAYNALKAMAK